MALSVEYGNSSEGLNTTLAHSEALKLFDVVHAQLTSAVDEEEPAPEVVPEQELFADPNRSFWFVGAARGGTDDQSQRFISDGVWDTDNDNISDEVKRMKPGDLIASRPRSLARTIFRLTIAGSLYLACESRRSGQLQKT